VPVHPPIRRRLPEGLQLAPDAADAHPSRLDLIRASRAALLDGRRKVSQALLSQAQKDRLRERPYVKSFVAGETPRGFSLSSQAARLRAKPEVLARAALLRHQASGRAGQITARDIERARGQLSVEQDIAEEIIPVAPPPGAVIRRGVDTDIDAVILAVADSIHEKPLPDLETPRVCSGQAARNGYFRKFTVGVRDGRNLAAVTKALATFVTCIETRLEVVPHSNTWLGLNVRFSLPGKQRWSENEDISRYKRTERRGTHSVDPYTKTHDLEDIFEQIVVGPGGEYSVRTDPKWAPRPLEQYFEKPARWIEIAIENGFIITRLDFYLWRGTQPDARPNPKDLE
jgi:hypothetical protein